MRSSYELKELRESKINEMDTLLGKARDEAPEGENTRDFTEAEQKRFDLLNSEIKNLDKEIDRAIDIEDAEKRSLAAKNQKPITRQPKDTEDNLYKKFSWKRAIQIAANMATMDGAEKEVHDIAVEEGKRSGNRIEGFGIPQSLFLGARTMLTAGTPATAGDLIKESYSPLLQGLIPKLFIEKLGARVTTGHSASIERVKTDYFVAEWEAEAGAVNEKNAVYTKTSYLPEKLGAFTAVTKKMLVQDGYGLEADIVNKLRQSISIALDKTAINGGGSNEPSGILANASIGSVVMGTNGGVPTRAKLVELESAIETALANVENLAFLTTPGMKALLRELKVDAGSGLYVWNEMNKVIGYNAYASTQVPSTLTKGGSSGNCHAIILGDFSQIELCQFGNLDLIVDPYTAAKEGYINIVANSFWNVIIDYPEYFAAIEDALLTAYTS